MLRRKYANAQAGTSASGSFLVSDFICHKLISDLTDHKVDCNELTIKHSAALSLGR
jgi:hypothetical protein